MDKVLDITTLSFTSVLLCLIFGVTLIVYSLKHPRFNGIAIIGCGFLFSSAGFFLLGFLNIVDASIAVISANTLLLFGLVMICEGLIFFNQIENKIGKYVAILLLLFMLPSFIYHSYVEESLKGKIVTISICYVIECLRCSYILFTKRNKTIILTTYILPIAFLLFAIFFAYRIMFTLNEQALTDFAEAGTVHAFTFITIQAMVLITSLSVFWITSTMLEKELLDLSRIDPLTSVFNRRALDDLAGVEMTRSIRKGHQLSILMCDIDHFKRVNDDYGHQVGDTTLVDFSHILKSNVRKHDIVSRYGGEEFLIMLPETNAVQAGIIAEKLRVKIEAHRVTIDLHEPLAITASFGVACYENGMENWEQISQNSDEALYRAKSKGRNCVVQHGS